MVMADELTDQLAILDKGQEEVRRQFAQVPDVATHLQFFDEQIVTYYSGTKIERQGLGSSFILGDSQYGILGTTTPQPYLGEAGTGAWVTLINQSTGSPFLNTGRTQIRDLILGSSAAVAPTTLLFGSGTQAWVATQSGLQFQHSTATATRAGEGVQYGSFYATISNAASNPGSYTEIAISGGAVFTRDVFTAQAFPSAGSQMRFTAVFRIGS